MEPRRDRIEPFRQWGFGQDWIALVALATTVACGPATADSRLAVVTEPAPPPAPAPEPPPEQTGDEVAEPPAPDAATLANGRTLALPGPTGYLSTWQILASGPRDAEAEAALGTPCEECPAPRVVSFAEDRVDLEACRRREHHDTVYLGATLLAPRETRVYLMVGMRGRASVRLDGEEIVSGDSPDRPRRDLLLAVLSLSEGEHRLVIRFDAPRVGRWRGTIRFLSDRTEAGPGNVAIAVGTLTDEEADSAIAGSVRFEERHELTAEGPVVRLRADLPGGGVRGPVDVGFGEERGTLEPSEGLHAGWFEVTIPMPARGDLEIRGTAGDRRQRFGHRIASDRGALLAAASLAESLTSTPEGSRAAVDWRRRELLRAVREHDNDQRWRNYLSAEARRIARDLARDRDPFGSIRGYERMAFYSRLDDTPQGYELFVPPRYRPGGTREWPLLVTLHGFSGNAGDYFRNTFALPRDYAAGQSLLAHGRHGPAPTQGPMIVIAPTGRGRAYFRHAGEVDVFEAMADVRRRFRVADNRIYVTGGSMGGTGAAYVPYRNPDVFAAAAALAGYHDQRVRADTNHAGLSETERFLQAHRSDVDWAENGIHLPMLLVRGSRDRPVEWTRCLARRLDALHYRHEHREPDLGHNVWNETYSDGAIFRWLGRYRRPSHPRRVRLRTARERTLSSFWVRVEQRAAPDVFADVNARIMDGVVTATIEGARAVTFSPEPPLIEPGADLVVRIGDTELSGPPPLTIERAGDTWRVATQAWPEEGTRRAGVSGPIRDVYHEPLTFVVGTQDPAHTLINRLVAEHWAHPRGWIVEYPILDDVDVTEEMMAERTLVLIGPPASNLVLARFADRLPIRIDRDAIHVGEQAHQGEQVGTVFVAPNPEHPEHAVLVIAGPRPLGTWRSTFLPDILPDYVVFDERVAVARDRWACGGTEGCEYRAHGLFDMRMRLAVR